MTAVTIALVVGAILGGFVQGLSGFAFALIATSIWVWFIEPHILVPLLLGSGLVGQIASSHATIGKNFSMSRSSPFLIGGLVGVPIGVSIFQQINESAFRVGVGMILIAYCFVMLAIAHSPRVVAGGKLADGIVGVISGVMGGLGGLSGPVPVVWCALRGWNKDIQRATFQPLFILVGVFTCALYAAAGNMTMETLGWLAIVTPVVILSSRIGAKVYHAVPERAFRKTLLILLLISGFTLVTPAVFKLIVTQTQAWAS